jgi:hypothetical protein
MIVCRHEIHLSKHAQNSLWYCNHVILIELQDSYFEDNKANLRLGLIDLALNSSGTDN